jgi:alkyl hydroperoxide reductase subunit AhpC
MTPELHWLDYGVPILFLHFVLTRCLKYSKCSGLFIISPTGILRQITINDLPVGRNVDETLRLVKAFQFTGEHDVSTLIPVHR